MLQAGQWSSTIAWQDIEVWKEHGEEDLGVLASCAVENDVMTGRNFGTATQLACNFKGGVCSMLTWAVDLVTSPISSNHKDTISCSFPW